jgi:hypothetical protein
MLLRRAAIRDDRLKPTAIHASLGKEEAKAMTAAFVRLRKRQRKTADQFGRIIVWRWPHKEATTFPHHPREDGGKLGGPGASEGMPVPVGATPEFAPERSKSR